MRLISGTRRIVLLLALVLPRAIASADPLPAEFYAAMPQADNVRLSPDGRSVAMIAPRDGRNAVRVWHPDAPQDWFLPNEQDQLNWIAWKSSDRLLMSLRSTQRPDSDHPVGLTRLVFTDVAEKKLIKVVFRDRIPPFSLTTIGRDYHPPDVQDRVISMLPNDPDHILLAASDDWVHPDPMMVDVHRGMPWQVIRPVGNVVRWLADANGVIRLKISLESRGEGHSQMTLRVRDGDSDDWRVIRRFELDRDPRFVPLAFSKLVPATLLVMADQPDGHLALQEMDTHSLVMGPVLAADPHCDIEPVLRDGQVVGYGDPCRGQSETYFDRDWQTDQALLQTFFKTPLVEILDRTPDGKFALVKTEPTPASPPSYWYFDQSGAKKILNPIADAYDKQVSEHIAPVRQVSIAARDGLILPALLTLPPDRLSGPIGFVVLPHGGPAAHDKLGFDWLVQFIASRGYGVLQPQFRGSTGYGAAFQRAGYRQWGGKMQDDVTDATRWLIEQKLADPKRICIAGLSYGGYAALMGAATQPDLYQCVVAVAPVTDIDRLLDDRDFTEFADIVRDRIAGDRKVPSPIDMAASITAPVLLIHGRRDFTVPIAHSEAMERRLTQAGHKPRAVYIDDADHGFSRAADRLICLHEMDAFLRASLGNGLPHPPS